MLNFKKILPHRYRARGLELSKQTTWFKSVKLTSKKFFPIDIAHVESGERVTSVSVPAPSFTVSWHPKRNLLAYACDDGNRDRDRESGSLKVWGFPTDDSK